jgi:transposase-like protein
MKRAYSPDFKRSIVQKIMMPGGPGIMEIAKQVGVHHTSIRHWRRLYAINSPMNSSNKKTPEEKFKLVFESLSLSKNELGEFLRKHGLHTAELDEWKKAFFDSQKAPGRPRKDPELASVKKKNKEIERDLRRKDRALAEMSARIILLKKSRLLWGEPEEEE